MPSMSLVRPCDPAGRNHAPVNASFLPSSPRGRSSAFTLIEILVVVAILAMLAAVAMHQLLRARITTHEQLALNSLRLLAKSCQFFSLVRQEFPSDLTELGPPTSNPPYVEAALRNGSPPAKQGYEFVYLRPAPFAFTLRANPQTHGITGERHFFINETLVIHATSANQDATVSDPVVP